MNKNLAFTTLALLASIATAQIPQSMLFQGQLSQDGVAFTGKQPMVINLCDALSAGSCTQVFNDSVTLSNGYYAVQLRACQR